VGRGRLHLRVREQRWDPPQQLPGCWHVSLPAASTTTTSDSPEASKGAEEAEPGSHVCCCHLMLRWLESPCVLLHDCVCEQGPLKHSLRQCPTQVTAERVFPGEVIRVGWPGQDKKPECSIGVSVLTERGVPQGPVYGLGQSSGLWSGLRGPMGVRM
jgi:hypothetical protein